MSIAAPAPQPAATVVPPTTALTTGQGWGLALVATLTMAVSYADRQALAVLAPTVTRALDISETAYGWLLSAFSLAYLVGAPYAGRWIDSIGARRGLLRAVLVWTAVAALHALVPGLAVLFLLRIALGLAESPSFPGATQTIYRALPAADRPRGYGVLFIGSSLGAILVPPVATALEHRYNFRIAFLGTAAIGLLWVPLWLWVTRRGPARARLDEVLPAAASSNRSTLEWIRHPAMLRAMAITLAASPVMSYALNWSAKFLVTDYGVTQAGVGKLLWLPPLLYDLGSIGFGLAASAQLRKLGLKAGPPRALVAASLLLTLILALVPFAGTPWTATILMGLALAGAGGLFALNTADMLARVPPGAVSTCAGLSVAVQSVGYIIANPLIGRGVEVGGHSTVILALTAWAVPGCVAWLVWRAPPRVNDAPTTLA